MRLPYLILPASKNGANRIERKVGTRELRDSLLQVQNHILEVLFSHILKYFKSTAGNSSSRSSILRPKLRSRQPSSKAPEGFLLLQNRFNDFQLKLLKKLSFPPILDDNEKADPHVARAQDVFVTGFFLSEGMLCMNIRVKAVMASVRLKFSPAGIDLEYLIITF